ncbi:sugar nucleotide-binding protein [Undibacterium arcticum]
MPLGEVIAVDRARCDLSRPDTIAALIQDIRPDVVVNAAAYTAVDKAEQEEALATVINGTAVGVLAQEARKANALLIHYSTDYVFRRQQGQALRRRRRAESGQCLRTFETGWRNCD